MTSWEPVETDLDRSDAEILGAALSLAGHILHLEIVALVTTDQNNRMGIIPIPGDEVEILRLLAQTDWSVLIRLAEESTA